MTVPRNERQTWDSQIVEVVESGSVRNADRVAEVFGAARVVPVRSVAHGFKVWKWSCPNCHADIETLMPDDRAMP